MVTTIVGTMMGVRVATIFERGREHAWSREEVVSLVRRRSQYALIDARLSQWRTAPVVIEDDGAGIDWPKLEAKAERAGAPCTTHDELVEALFRDGVSTKDDVTDLSGRGVGMAAVRAATRHLGGDIEVRSEPGQGTRLEFSIPAAHLTGGQAAA